MNQRRLSVVGYYGYLLEQSLVSLSAMEHPWLSSLCKRQAFIGRSVVGYLTVIHFATVMCATSYSALAQNSCYEQKTPREIVSPSVNPDDKLTNIRDDLTCLFNRIESQEIKAQQFESSISDRVKLLDDAVSGLLQRLAAEESARTSADTTLQSQTHRLENRVSQIDITIDRQEKKLSDIAYILANTGWTPLLKDLGRLPFDTNQTVTLPIPSDVPGIAREIFLFIAAETGNSTGDGARVFSIWVDIDGRSMESQFLVHAYSQPAWSYNSDTFWLPMPKNRNIFIKRLKGANIAGNSASAVKMLGYR